MRDFFITFILIIVIVLIIAGVGILGINIYNDINIEEVGSTVQNVISDFNVATDEKQNYTVNENQNYIINETQNTTSVLNNIQSTTTNSTEDKNITYSNKSSKNNYFYSQLNDYSKTIYNGLENNIENLKTGTYSIEFGNDFSSILSSDDGQEILGEYYQSAIEAFMYDNPQIFYLNVNKMYLNIESTKYTNRTTYNVYIGNGNEKSYLADGFSSKSQIEECEKQIQKVKNKILSGLSGTDYEKILKIHDYFI
jgi:hypothetical protein